MRKTQFNVRLRHQLSGDEQDRVVFAETEDAAKDFAIFRARQRQATMAEREYGQFDVLSCTRIDGELGRE